MSHIYQVTGYHVTFQVPGITYQVPGQYQVSHTWHHTSQFTSSITDHTSNSTDKHTMAFITILHVTYMGDQYLTLQKCSI